MTQASGTAPPLKAPHALGRSSISTGSDRPANDRPYLTVALASIGTALEYYDFIIFVFFVKILSRLFFPPSLPEWIAQIETFGIFAAGYLARPLGGIILAHYGDLLGRKKMFMLTIVMMASSSLGMAVIPTYASIGVAAPSMLLLFRLLQSVAVGGEVPGAWTFVAEHVPHRRLGLACGMTCSGIVIGIFFGSLTSILINSWFSVDHVQSFAWRLPFLLGGCSGIGSVFLRRQMTETPVFEWLQTNQALAAQWPFRVVLKNHLRSAVVSFALGSFLNGCIVTIFLITPTLLQTTYSVSAVTALQADLIASGAAIFSPLGAGLLVDWIGGGLLLAFGNVLLAASAYLLYTQIADHPSWLPLLYALTGFCSGVLVAVPYMMVKSFPPAVRFTGIALSYNLASAIVGGLTPIIVTYSLHVDPMAHMHYLLVVCTIGALIGVTSIMRTGGGDPEFIEKQNQ